MNIMVVYTPAVVECPPVISVLNGLRKLGHNVTLCTADIDNSTEKMLLNMDVRHVVV